MTDTETTSLARFRRLALVAWFFQGLIVASGAAVRLTKSGLGCADWPTCNEGKWTPDAEFHDWIEYGNRLISVVVTVSTIALLVAAWRYRPRRDDLVAAASWLAAGTLAQVVLGGITVLLDLNPVVVSIHFLVSMGLLWMAGRAWWRSSPLSEQPTPRLALADRRLSVLMFCAASVVLLTGTVVTGSGPHSGDDEARRLGFELVTVARVHAVTVWILVATVVLVAVRLNRKALPDQRGRAAARLSRYAVGIALAQGALGYIQFALGVPAALVEAHVVGALGVWTVICLLVFHLLDQPYASQATPGQPTTDSKDADRASVEQLSLPK